MTQPGRIREDLPEEVTLNHGGQISMYRNAFRGWGKAEGEWFMSHEAGEKYRARLACWAHLVHLTWVARGPVFLCSMGL